MRRKNSRAISTICVILVIVLLAVFLGYVTSGFKNWDVRTWFKPEAEGSIAKDENGNEMNSGESYAMPENLMFLGARSMSANGSIPGSVTLTATIKPANAANKSVTWTAAWKDPADVWATGKTVADYITIAPASAGSTTATVSCPAAFGAKIKITVMSEDNPTATAECVVDYAKKITGVSMHTWDNISDIIDAGEDIEYIYSSDSSESFLWELSLDYDIFGRDRDFQISPVVGVGTVEDEPSITTILKVTPEFDQALIAMNFPEYSSDFAQSIEIFSSISQNAEFMSLLFGSETIESVESINKLINLVNNTFTGNMFTIDVVLDGKYSDATYTFYGKFHFYDDGYRVTDIEINDGTIIF